MKLSVPRGADSRTGVVSRESPALRLGQSEGGRRLFSDSTARLLQVREGFWASLSREAPSPTGGCATILSQGFSATRDMLFFEINFPHKFQDTFRPLS